MWLKGSRGRVVGSLFFKSVMLKESLESFESSWIMLSYTLSEPEWVSKREWMNDGMKKKTHWKWKGISEKKNGPRSLIIIIIINIFFSQDMSSQVEYFITKGTFQKTSDNDARFFRLATSNKATATCNAINIMQYSTKNEIVQKFTKKHESHGNPNTKILHASIYLS